MSGYGKFNAICRDTGGSQSTVPVCNLFDSDYGGCTLSGIGLPGGRNIANLGTILVAAAAILLACLLLFRSELKRAAVGRREMQIFLIGYIIMSICEIVSIGHFPLSSRVRKGFSAAHVAAVVATAWVLMLNAVVGYQLIHDGTFFSITLVLSSAAALFVGTGYIALDTAFSWTGYWASTTSFPHQSYSLYTLYFLATLLFIVLFFVLEAILVLRILKEKRPLFYLTLAALLFTIGQIFQFVASVHICNSTGGRINGGFLQTLFTLLAVLMVWVFWSSITEDDWTTPATGGTTYA